MKKMWVVALIFGLLLTGCQQKANGTLDTTNLVKTEPEGNITEDQLKSIPISYEAPSMEEGLAALPFKIKLPSEFPFEAMPLKLSSIEDFKHDGKELRVNFDSVSKNKGDQIALMITVHNFKVEYADPVGDEVKLAKDMVGNYNGNSLIFEKNGIYYAIGYNNPNISIEQHLEDMIEIANQML